MRTKLELFKEFRPVDLTGSLVNASETNCSLDDLSIRRAKEMIPLFPTTRYYGSKKRLLTWLFNNLKDIPFNSVLDGFGGTASVSLLFKAMGKEVTYNDALISNVTSAKALLANELPIRGTMLKLSSIQFSH